MEILPLHLINTNLMLSNKAKPCVSKHGHQAIDRATIYILLCSDKSYYTGITRREIAERVDEHQRGLNPRSYTFKRRPVELCWCAHFERIDEAIATERRIKRWTRAKKEALIRGDYDALPDLASRSRGKKEAFKKLSSP